MAPQTPDSDLLEKFTNLEAALNNRIFERQAEIKTSLAALISRRHHFQYGPKGIAKSLLVRQIFAHIGGLEPHHLFQILLTPYTTPEEVFGLPSLKAMEQDQYRRNTDYKLSESLIAFLDEIFNASSANLNTLLTILNERLFFNGSGPEPVGLGTVFSASNVMPSGNELEAMYDRLHFRHHVKPLADRSNRLKMLKFAGGLPEKLLTWDHILQAQDMVESVEIPQHVLEELIEIGDELKKNDIEVSDRRTYDSLNIIRATAFLNNRLIADTEDLRLLRHVFWSRPDQISFVSQVVMNMANPIDMQAISLREDVDFLGEQVESAIANSDSGRNVGKILKEVWEKLINARNDMKELEVRAVEEGRKSEELPLLRERLIAVDTRIKEYIH